MLDDGYALGDSDSRDERRDLIEAIDAWPAQPAGLQLIVFAQLVFELPNHALVATPDGNGALDWRLMLRLRERFPKALDLSYCPISLRIAFDHARLVPPTRVNASDLLPLQWFQRPLCLSTWRLSMYIDSIVPSREGLPS